MLLVHVEGRSPLIIFFIDSWSEKSLDGIVGPVEEPIAARMRPKKGELSVFRPFSRWSG
jgi:hypothetical protein